MKTMSLLSFEDLKVFEIILNKNMFDIKTYIFLIIQKNEKPAFKEYQRTSKCVITAR